MHKAGQMEHERTPERELLPGSIWAQQEEQTTPLRLSLLLCKMATVSPTTQLLCGHLPDEKAEEAQGRMRTSPSLPSEAENVFAVAGI